MGRDVYLDNNATTMVPDEVLNAMLPFYKEKYGNASSMHTFGGRVAKDMEHARHQVALAGGDALVIDEAYNANPLSMSATLAQLGQEKATRRIAVLGAMKELGDQADAYHAALAEPIAAARVDFAILVGEEMHALAQRLEGSVAFAHVPDAREAAQLLASQMLAGDAILIKGSNSVGLARVVAAITGGEQ